MVEQQACKCGNTQIRVKRTNECSRCYTRRYYQENQAKINENRKCREFGVPSWWKKGELSEEFRAKLAARDEVLKSARQTSLPASVNFCAGGAA